MEKENKKPKIVCYPFVGDSIGGSQIATINLYKCIDRKKYQPLIVLFQHGPLESYLDEKNIQYEVIGNIEYVKQNNILFQIVDIVKISIQLKKYIKDNNIALVHTNDNRMHCTWLLASKFSSIPMLWHQHSAYYTRRNILYSCFARKILTVSQFCKASFPLNMSKRAEVVGNPFIVGSRYINKDVDRDNVRNELAIDKNTLLVGYIGNSNTQKRAKFFIDVAKNVNHKIENNIHFIMLGKIKGDWLDKNELNKNNIHMMGQVSLPEEYISGVDLFVAPAINEGFGRTLIESMLVKTPVLASSSGAHTEIVQDNVNGFLATPDSIEEFSDKILHLLKKNTDVKNVTENAHEYVREKFNINKYIKSIENSYEEIL